MSFLLLFLYLTTAQIAPHAYSTLFTAQDMNKYLSTDEGTYNAISWSKDLGLTRVFMETWRDGTLVDVNVMKKAKSRFESAGFPVSGCVCTTNIGKPSTGWNLANCYTNQTTQAKLQYIFEYTASIFDEIIIDDFYFTDCTCDECTAGFNAHEVVVGDHHVHVDDDPDGSCFEDTGCQWKDYRRTLMQQVSTWNVLDAAQKVNPNVKIIIKFPDWYDVYQDFGYDTAAETNLFPAIWVGTESRDYTVNYIPQYFGFFIMRWLGGIGGEKCGGGWFDPYSSSPETYVEQARMTVLGGAKESFLFEYGSLITEGQANVNALKLNIPELREVSAQVRKRNIVGVAAYKPPNSHGGCITDPEHSSQCKGEDYIFDFVGMLGIPLFPIHDFPTASEYPSAFFSTHVLKDPDVVAKLSAYVAVGNPTLVTDGLKTRIGNSVNLDVANVFVLNVGDYPPNLLTTPPPNIDSVRMALLAPLGWQFTAPVRTSLFPFSDGSWIVENFNDAQTTVVLNQQNVLVPARSWVYKWNSKLA